MLSYHEDMSTIIIYQGKEFSHHINKGLGESRDMYLYFKEPKEKIANTNLHVSWIRDIIIKTYDYMIL